MLVSFLFNAPPTPEIYTLSLHDALPIYVAQMARTGRHRRGDRRLHHRLGSADDGAGGGDDAAGDRRSNRPSRDGDGDADRKSTRLNSSHLGISYAVFCLKKKKE